MDTRSKQTSKQKYAPSKALEVNDDLDIDDEQEYQDEYNDDFEESYLDEYRDQYDGSDNKAKLKAANKPGKDSQPSATSKPPPAYLGQNNLTKLPKGSNVGGVKSIMSEDRATLNSNADKYIQKFAEKHPLKAMEKAVLDARRTLDKMKGAEETVESIEEEEQKMIFVDNQNKKLRKELKKMNDNLNNLLDYIKDLNLKKKKKQDKPIDQVLRTRNEEIKNSDKQMMNLMNEHQRLQKRLEEVSNPNYMIDLRNSIKEAEDKIKELKKDKKALEVEQFRREKKMDKIINHGEPENMKSINDAQKELEVVTDKLNKLKAKKEQLSEFKLKQDSQMDSLRQKLEKVMQKAKDYGIDEDIKREELKIREEQQNADKESLLRKKKVMLQAFESQK